MIYFENISLHSDYMGAVCAECIPLWSVNLPTTINHGFGQTFFMIWRNIGKKNSFKNQEKPSLKFIILYLMIRLQVDNTATFNDIW